jgi:hypothetical protein
MNDLSQINNIIAESKNIYLITSQEPEAAAATMALFYTLKDSEKNVNVILDKLPENLKFLTPDTNFISYPKNFIISIPNNVAEVSQIHYEKTSEDLKIHLSLENGYIKKDNISFYFSESKPDLVITIGIQDYQKELSENLDSLGFLLDCPVVNIDNSQNNQKFGKINIVEEKPLAKVIFDLNTNINNAQAECLLTSLAVYTKNFNKNQTAETFELASVLMKQGINLEKITNNLNSND